MEGYDKVLRKVKGEKRWYIGYLMNDYLLFDVLPLFLSKKMNRKWENDKSRQKTVNALSLTCLLLIYYLRLYLKPALVYLDE